jgi:hypothetical protein
MEAWNNAYIEAMEAASTNDEIMFLLAAGPMTQKRHHNALAYTPLYRQAYEAQLKGLKRLPRAYVRCLRDDLRYAAYRAHTPLQEQKVEGGPPWVRLVRPEWDDHSSLRDQWFLEVPRRTIEAIGERTYEEAVRHPIYLRAGHLVASKLTVKTAAWPTAEGGHVLSVLVQTARGGAFACEVVFRHGRERFSAWRKLGGGDIHDALLPHIGRAVRLGDVVIRATARSSAPYGSLPCERPHYLERVEFPAGEFLTAPDGVFFQLENPTYPTHSLRLSHPDHYTVEVHLDVGQILHIMQVPGRTQYLPRWDQGD